MSSADESDSPGGINAPADHQHLPAGEGSQETLHPSSQVLQEAAVLKLRHQRNASTSDSSDQSSGFDEERRPQDDDDIDNTPATSYGGFHHSRSDASTGAKSDSSHISNAVLMGSAQQEMSEDPSRTLELQQEVQALFNRFLPEHQVQQELDDDPKAAPGLLSRDLPAMLTEFERQRERALIHPKVFTQLEYFADENPEVPITSDMLVNLIHALESSAQSAASEDPSPTSPSFPDEKGLDTDSGSTPVARLTEVGDLSLDEHLIRDADGSRDSSRELSAEAAMILNLKEDLRIEREKSDAVQQILSDKERKMNTLEHKLVTLQEQYEETMLEEQAKAEVLQNQIQTLRKDEKDLRIQYHELQEQNSSYEAQLAALTLQNENAEKANAKLKRELEDESDQVQKLTEDLARRVKEYKELSEYLFECEQARDTAERSVSQLKQDLDKARADGSRLQKYKEETETLRETVDKIEMELDEVRRVASLHSKESSLPSNSNPPTLTRRLGNELARTIDLNGHISEDDTQVDEEEDVSHVDDFFETVIQRRRRRVGKARQSVEFSTQGIQTEELETAHVVADSPSNEASLPQEPPSSTRFKAHLFDHSFTLPLFRGFRLVSLFAALLSIGIALGLIFNTSRDIYHINHQSLDADDFRKLNYLPNTVRTFYYDGRYPNAMIGNNFVDDYIGPVLDAVLSVIGLGNLGRSLPSEIVY